MNQLATITPNPLTALSYSSPAESLVASFLAGRGERTLAAYRQDLEDFRAFVGTATAQAAAKFLLSLPHGEANALVLAYRAQLLGRGLAAATINRRLAAVRSMGKLARTLGLIPWQIEIEGVKAESYRDTRGPGREGVRKLLDLTAARQDSKGSRDRAILRLLFDLGLRRGEVAALDLQDLSLEAGLVAILGKGRSQKVALTLPEPTKQALAAWLTLRGPEAGPLFTNLDRAGKGQRLTGRSIHRIVKDLGCQIGIELRPHGLRHAAITEALDIMKGNIRAVQRFSRHKDLRVLTVYDDNRQDLGGEVAKLLAAVA